MFGTCRPGGALRSTNLTIVISTRLTRARHESEGGTKVHAASDKLHDSYRRRARGSARKGVRAAQIARSRHSGTAGRETRQEHPASRFHVNRTPVGGHPLSFPNDLVRMSTPSNPRSFGPSCRVPPLPAPPLRLWFLRASTRSGGEGILAVFFVLVEGTDSLASKKGTSKCRTSSSSPQRRCHA